MKKLIVVLMLCVLVVGGCSQNETDVYSWVWGDDDAIGARVGTNVGDSNNVEVGLSALWWPDRERPEIWGMYGIYSFPEILEVPNPIVMEFLPETISGRPYLGGKVDIDFSGDKSRASPIAGIVFEDIFFIEYQFDSIDRDIANDSKLIFGIRIDY